jgi:hypothetical protein
MNPEVLNWLMQGGFTMLASAGSAWGVLKATQRSQGIEIRDLKEADKALHRRIDEVEDAQRGTEKLTAGISSDIGWIKETLKRIEEGFRRDRPGRQ